MMTIIKTVSFSDGVRQLNTKGALVIPGTRLTKARARMLKEFINQFQHNWYANHDKDNSSKEDEDDMQLACQWLVNQINKRWSQNELYKQQKK